MLRILCVTILVVLGKYSEAAGMTLIDKTVNKSTSSHKPNCMRNPNLIFENATVVHKIFNSLSNILMSKARSDTKEQREPKKRKKRKEDKDININIKVGFEANNMSQSEKPKKDCENINNVNKKKFALDELHNPEKALEESYETLTGNIIKETQPESKKHIKIFKVPKTSTETVVISKKQPTENDNSRNEIESDVASAETYLVKEDNNAADSNEYLVEYDEPLKQVTEGSKSKSRFGIINKQRATGVVGHINRYKVYKKPNLLTNMIKNNVPMNNLHKIIKVTKNYNQIVEEVTTYPQIKDKRFKILAKPRPMIKKIIKVKKIPINTGEKLQQSENVMLNQIQINENVDTIIPLESYPNKQRKVKYQKLKNNIHNKIEYQEQPEHETPSDDEKLPEHKTPKRNKTRIRQNNDDDYFNAEKANKDTVIPGNNISDGKFIIDTVLEKLKDEALINNLTDYLINKMVQRVSLKNKLAKNSKKIERIFIDLKGELTEVEGDSADWSEPSQEVRVLGGARNKTNLTIRRLILR